MRPCSDLDKFLVGDLFGKSLAEFERHLEACSECQTQVEQWKQIEKGVSNWSTGFDLPNPTAAEAAELVVGLEPKSARRVWQRPVFAMSAVAATVAVFVLIFVFGNNVFEEENSKTIAQLKDTDSDMLHPIRVIYSERCEIPTAESGFARRLVVPGDGTLVFELGDDRIGLAAKSELQILFSNAEETRLRIDSGEVGVEAASRKHGGSFIVEAGNCEVKVVGTRFKVSLDDSSNLAVSVDEGELMVTGPGDTAHRVKAGQILELVEGDEWNYIPLDDVERSNIASMLKAPAVQNEDAMVAAKTEESRAKAIARSHPNNEGTSVVPDDDKNDGPSEWRKWILEGQYERAEAALLKQLKKSPKDTTAMSLLANCRRKSGDFRGAVNVYERIIGEGGSKAARAARYDAAVLLQDRLGKHARAAGFLSAYLKDSPLLEAEATLRLARARIRMGRLEAGRNLLIQVKERHRSTSAAIEAERLLSKMDDANQQ